MTISFWDAGLIAGWVVFWLFLLLMVIAIIGAVGKKRRQKNEVYERLRRAVNTQDEFEQIIRKMKDGDTK